MKQVLCKSGIHDMPRRHMLNQTWLSQLAAIKAGRIEKREQEFITNPHNAHRCQFHGNDEVKQCAHPVTVKLLRLDLRKVATKDKI